MELELGVEDLLNKRKLESDQIEFKTGWNPDFSTLLSSVYTGRSGWKMDFCNCCQNRTAATL